MRTCHVPHTRMSCRCLNRTGIEARVCRAAAVAADAVSAASASAARSASVRSPSAAPRLPGSCNAHAQSVRVSTRATDGGQHDTYSECGCSPDLTPRAELSCLEYGIAKRWQGMMDGQ